MFRQKKLERKPFGSDKMVGSVDISSEEMFVEAYIQCFPRALPVPRNGKLARCVQYPIECNDM